MSLIHRYQSNGYNIVLDINSGCIHLVDLVTYEVLPCMENELIQPGGDQNFCFGM